MESDPLREPVNALKEKGIFIPVIDRRLSENGIQDLYVAGNNPQCGVTSAQYFLNKLPNGAKIVVLRGIPTAIDNIRIKAFEDTLKEHRPCWAKRPARLPWRQGKRSKRCSV